MSVEAWLGALGLGQYAAAFAANHITVDLLPSLTAADLRDVGVMSIGHRRRMLDAIAARKTARSSDMPPTVPEPLAGRRQVSVMFCDLVGSTALSARLDPEELSALIRAYQQRVNDIVARYHGFIARYLGDGVLIYFGWPEAREDDPERAVRAALDIAEAVSAILVRGERARVRIGIATGLVVIGERVGENDSLQYTAIGETPNRAARLQGIATANAAVIDAGTRQRIGDLFELRDLGPQSLAGLPDPVPTWAVLGDTGMLSRFEALHGATLSPFVGRNDELDLLLRRWREARSGRGNVVMISGEAGIGKSRLVAALNEQLRGQPHIRLRYFCLPHRIDTPLAAFGGQFAHAAGFARGDTPAEQWTKLHRVLTPRTSVQDMALIAGVLSMPPDPGMPALEMSASRRKEATFEAISRQMASLAESRPLLVLGEDLQWADPTSLELLDHLFGMIRRLPILVVLTLRPEYVSPWIGRPDVSMLTLERLRPDETAAIAARLAPRPLPHELIEHLVARSDGVPLFIEELVRFVTESAVATHGEVAAQVPHTLQGLFLSRLDRLPAARVAAQLGSVFGHSFSRDMLAAIAGISDRSLNEGLEQLVSGGFALRRGDGDAATFQFSHALVRDTAYQSMLLSRRSELHAAVVALLEKDPDVVRDDPALIAHHSAEAGLAAQAMRHFLAAAEQTAARGAMREALTHLSRGLKLASDNPDVPDMLAWRTRYQLMLGEVLGALRFYVSPEAGAALAEAVTLARLVSPANKARDPLLARSLFGYFVHQIYLGAFRLARALSEELLTLGRDRGNPGIATLGAIANGICRVYQGELPQARALFDDTLEAWRPFDFPEAARVLGLDPVSVLTVFRARLDSVLGFPDTAVAAARAALQRVRGLHHVRSLAIVVGTAWDTFSIAGEEDDLRQATREWDTLANEQGFQFYLTRARYCSGWIRMRDGDIASGNEMVEEAVRDLDSVGVVLDSPQILSMLADTREAMGDSAGALTALERGLATATTDGVIWWNAELLWRRAQVRHDDPHGAEADFRAALRAARRQSARTQELRAATAYAVWLLSVGRGEDARAALAPVLGWFTEGRHRPDQRAAAALLTQIDSGRGDWARVGVRRQAWRV
jgi:class 3 adenylate cyclase/tetratricopeptide (TPR) repeat protein